MSFTFQEAVERSEQPPLFFWHRYSWLFIVVLGIILLTGFTWLELQRATTRNIWWGELQDTKRISIMAERECGTEVWEQVKMYR